MKIFVPLSGLKNMTTQNVTQEIRNSENSSVNGYNASYLSLKGHGDAENGALHDKCRHR